MNLCVFGVSLGFSFLCRCTRLESTGINGTNETLVVDDVCKFVRYLQTSSCVWYLQGAGSHASKGLTNVVKKIEAGRKESTPLAQISTGCYHPTTRPMVQ